MAAVEETAGAGNQPENGSAVKTPAKTKKVVTKAKKPAGAKKTKTAPIHPPFIKMITEAIVALKERSGSSQYAIQKYIEEHHKNLLPKFRKSLLKNLKKLVADEKLVKIKNSYKLPPKTAPKPAAPKPKPAKKPATKPAKAKPTKAKAKAPEKPKPVAKPKAAPKPAAKPKAAPKPKAKVPEKPKVTKPAAKVAKTSAKSTPVKKPVVKPVAKPAVKAKTPAAKPAAKAKTPVKKAKGGKAPVQRVSARTAKK